MEPIAGRPAPSASALRKCRILVDGEHEVFVQAGPLFLDTLNRHDFDLHNECGGNGKCGRCKIIFHTTPPECTKGDLRHLTEEQRAGGMRLACFHQVRDDCSITIPPAPETDLLDNL